MAFTRLQTSTTQVSFTGTSGSQSLGSPTTPGSCVVSWMKGSLNSVGVSQVTDDMGNIYAVYGPVTDSFLGSLALYVAIGVQVTGGATTVTWTVDSAGIAKRLLTEEYAYSSPWANNADAFRGTQSGTAASGTSLATAALGSSAGDLILCGGGLNTGTATWTAGSGYTLSAGASGQSQRSEYRLSGAGSDAPSMTIAASAAWALQALAFKPPTPTGVTASGSGTVGTLSGSGSATVTATITASGSGTVGTLSGSGSATVHVTITASGSGTVGTLAGSGSATIQATITGSGSGRVGTLSGSGSATITATITASGSGRVGTLAGSGSALVAVPSAVGTKAFVQVEVWPTWPYAGGPMVATIREWVTLRRTRGVGGAESWTLSLPITAPNFAALQPGRGLRAWFSDGTSWDGVLTDDVASVDDQGVAQLTGAGIASSMAQCPPCISVDGDGVGWLRFDSGPLTLAQHWSNFLAPALAAGGLSFVVMGTSDPTGTVDYTYDGVDPWTAIQALATATQTEVQITPLSGSSQFGIAWLTKVGAGQTGGELRVARNATIQRTRSLSPQATVVYPKLTDGATIGEAVWKVGNKSGGILTLVDIAGGAGPILADGQLVGSYLEAADRATRVSITASAQAAQTVTVSSATAFAIGDLVRVRADAAGTRLIALSHPVYLAADGVKSYTLVRDDLPGVCNLVPNAILASWSGAPPDGWAAVGSPTLSRITTPGLYQTGGQSCRVQSSADGVGLATPLFAIAPTADNPYGSGFVTYLLSSGAVRVELVATDGTSTWIVPDGVQQVATDTTIGTFVSVGVAGIDLHALGATSVRLRIVQHGGGAADFYVDAAQYTETSGQQAFVNGSGCTQGWQAANAYLALYAATQVRYDGKAVDFARIDPVNYAARAFLLGAQHAVVDEYLGYVDGVRVLEFDENALQESDTNITLSSRPEDIASLFASTPPARTAAETVNRRPVAGARTITDAAVTASSANLTSASAGFTARDIGKTIWVLSGASNGATLKSRITARVNATTVTLADTVTVSRTGLTAVYGNANDVSTLATTVGGDRAGSALFNSSGQLTSAVTDADSRAVLTFLAKLLAVDPDTLDSVPDGSTYLKQIPLLVIAAAQSATTATTVTYTISAADPTGGTAPTISWDHSSAVTDNHDGTYTIARNAAGLGPLNVLFTGSKTGRQSATCLAIAPEQASGSAVLTVTATPGTTQYSVAWSGTSPITLAIDGGGYSTPPSSPITVSMPPANAAGHVYTFRGADGSTDTVTIPAQGTVDTNTVTPDLSVTPGTQTATTVPFTVICGNPSGGANPGITCTLKGCTATGSVTGAIPDGVTTNISSGEVITCNRPSYGSTQAHATFAADLTYLSGGTEVIARTILAQEYVAPEIHVTPSTTSTTYSLAYTYVGTPLLSIDSGTPSTPPSSPISVSRNSAGGADKNYHFTSSNDGATASQDVIVLAQAGSGGGNPAVSAFYESTFNNTANTITLAWAIANMPGGGSLALRFHQTLADGSADDSGTITSSVTSPYAFGTLTNGTIDLVTKGTSGWQYSSHQFTLLVEDSGGSVVASASLTVSLYGVYSP